MKVSQDARTPEEFRAFAEYMSKYFDLRGCKTEKCINNRIKRIKSNKLNIFVEHNFASQLLYEAYNNPHPVYKKILGMDDWEYNYLVKKNRNTKY